jgi:hypothetical protein
MLPTRTANGRPFEVPFAFLTTKSPEVQALVSCTTIFWYHIQGEGGATITRQLAPFNVAVGEVRKLP